jgi:hypothetical protein
MARERNGKTTKGAIETSTSNTLELLSEKNEER